MKNVTTAVIVKKMKQTNEKKKKDWLDKTDGAPCYIIRLIKIPKQNNI